MTTTAERATAVPLPSTEQRHVVRSARRAFRNWRRSRPFWAGVWAILGGALVAYIPSTAFKLVFISNGSIAIGIGVGIVIGLFGLMLWFIRRLHVLLGFLILVLSLISFFTSDFGGFLVGMLMGLVGGSLAVAWVPTKVTRRERRRARKLAAAVRAEEVPDGDEGIRDEMSAMTIEADLGRPDDAAAAAAQGRHDLADDLLAEPVSAPSADTADTEPSRRST